VEDVSEGVKDIEGVIEGVKVIDAV